MYCLGAIQNNSVRGGRCPRHPRTHALSGKAAMGRPRKLNDARDRQFNVGLTAHEMEIVQRAARLAGMRPVDYGRARLLSRPGRIARTSEAVRHLDPLFLVQLSRIGNNLNQVARRLNDLALPEPEDLAPLLMEIRQILRSAGSP